MVRFSALGGDIVRSFTVMLGKRPAKIIFYISMAYFKSYMGLRITLHILFVIQYHRKPSAATWKCQDSTVQRKYHYFFLGKPTLKSMYTPSTPLPVNTSWCVEKQVTKSPVRYFPWTYFFLKFLMRNKGIILSFSFSEENVKYFK